MQDLEALQGKNQAELREIAKAVGVKYVMTKKKSDLIKGIIEQATKSNSEVQEQHDPPMQESLQQPR